MPSPYHWGGDEVRDRLIPRSFWTASLAKCQASSSERDNLRELALSFHQVGSRDRIQVVRLGGKHPYPLSHFSAVSLPAWFKKKPLPSFVSHLTLK